MENGPSIAKAARRAGKCQGRLGGGLTGARSFQNRILAAGARDSGNGAVYVLAWRTGAWRPTIWDNGRQIIAVITARAEVGLVLCSNWRHSYGRPHSTPRSTAALG